MTYDNSAYDAVYSAVVSRLSRPGVTVGKSAFLPRVEIHTITEGQRQDKGGNLRVLNLVVESISNRSLDQANEMCAKNLKLLTETPLDLSPYFSFIGILPVQLQDLPESSDSDKIVYRLLQQMDIYVSATGYEPAPSEPDTPVMPADPEDPPVDPEVEDQND
jgi:hypothetical protein